MASPRQSDIDEDYEIWIEAQPTDTQYNSFQIDYYTTYEFKLGRCFDDRPTTNLDNIIYILVKWIHQYKI